MLEGYSKTPEGVVYQVDPKPIDYNLEYIEYYEQLDRAYGEMSYLRLGNLIGSIGKIPHSVLDVGYGDGSFLRACKKIVPECYGYDISTYPVPEGCVEVDGLTTRHYDAITFFDSLEHFRDISFVKELNCNYVCVSVPFCHYKSDEWFENWKHRKPDEHLWHFNKESLTSFMSIMGFKLMTSSNIEDTIRKNKPSEENILTCIFEKVL